MEMLESILEVYPDEELLIADGFNNAIIGVEEVSMRLIYSVTKCLDILCKEGLGMDDAIEHFTFNVSGSYVGEKTPIWCWDTFL